MKFLLTTVSALSKTDANVVCSALVKESHTPANQNHSRSLLFGKTRDIHFLVL